MALSPQELAQQLERHVRPETFPLGIRFLAEGEAPPERARRPRALGFQAAICQAVGMARRYGWTFHLTAEDLSCPLALVVFGLRPRTRVYVEGHACAGMYTETAAAGARTEAATPHLEEGAYAGLLLGPLARWRHPSPPHVVLLYGNSAQVMRLVAAALWKEGGRIESSFSARIDCADEMIAPLLEEKPQVILPCYGDRVFGSAQDHEMAFSFPWGFGPDLVEGLEGTHRGGVRYPIPTFLRYEAVYPEHYAKIGEGWSRAEDDQTVEKTTGHPEEAEGR